MLARFSCRSAAPSPFHTLKNLLSLYTTKSQNLNSASARHSLAQYLIDSLEFSKEEASLASSKVASSSLSSKSLTKNPTLVINFFKQLGFNKYQIKEVVSKAPKYLFYDVTKTLKPKFQCLMDIGLTGSDLVNVIGKDITILERGLVTHLKPTVDSLKKIFVSNADFVKAAKKCSWLFSFGGHNVIETNLTLLRRYGVTNDKVKKLVLRNPRYITQKPEWVEDLLQRLENDFRVPVTSPMFPYGFHSLASQKKSNCDKKIEIFKSFGWSDEDVLTMFRKLPYCVAFSEVKIRKGLSFYMKDLGFGPAYLASRPSMLIYSLEKRVLPRMQVLKILDENKIERRKMALYSVVSLTETKFMENFVLPYKDQLPDLYEPLIQTTQAR